jgi:hypothetical protein
MATDEARWAVVANGLAPVPTPGAENLDVHKGTLAKLWTEGVFIMLVTAAAYLGCYCFEVGFTSYYNIPSDFIVLSIQNLLLFFGSIPLSSNSRCPSRSQTLWSNRSDHSSTLPAFGIHSDHERAFTASSRQPLGWSHCTTQGGIKIYTPSDFRWAADRKSLARLCLEGSSVGAMRMLGRSRVYKGHHSRWLGARTRGQGLTSATPSPPRNSSSPWWGCSIANTSRVDYGRIGSLRLAI